MSKEGLILKAPQATTFYIISMTLMCVGMFELFVTTNLVGFGVPLVAGALSLMIGAGIILRAQHKQ